jgi:hypothetical protein
MTIYDFPDRNDRNLKLKMQQINRPNVSAYKYQFMGGFSVAERDISKSRSDCPDLGSTSRQALASYAKLGLLCFVAGDPQRGLVRV